MRKSFKRFIGIISSVAILATSIPFPAYADEIEVNDGDIVNQEDFTEDGSYDAAEPLDETSVFEESVEEEEIEVSELEEDVDSADDEAEEMPVNGVSGMVYADGSCGTSTIWEIYKDGDEYTLVISGTGEVTSIGWTDYKSQITSVIVEDGVTILPKSAFSGSTALKSAVLTDDLNTLPDSAFYQCSSLSDVKLPNNIPYISQYAFYQCTALKKIIIPSSVTGIALYAFHFSSLEEIHIPSSCIYVLGYSDPGYNNYYGIYDPRFKPNSGPFYNVTWGNTVSIVITEGDDTDAFVDYKYASYYNNSNYTCDDHNLSAISYYNIHNHFWFNTPWYMAKISGKNVNVTINEGVSRLGEYMFYSSNLKNIDIPDSISSIGKACFSGCSSLKMVSGAKGVSTINESAFSGCTSLGNVSFENAEQINGSAFSGCTSFENVSFEKVKQIGSSAFLDCANLKNVVLGNSLTQIAASAFKNCTSITTLKMPMDAVIADETVFSGDNTITSVTLTPGKNKKYDFTIQTKNYTPWYISRNTLTEIKLEGDFSAIGDYTFSGISNVPELDVPETVKKIGSNTFANCASTSFNFTPKHRFTLIGTDAFKNCAVNQNIYFLYKYCTIGDSTNTIPDCFTIYGLEGSTAQSYAKKYNKTFVVYECPEDEHKWVKRAYPATDEEDGYYYNFCERCEKKVETGEVIKKIDKNSISLNQVEYYYDGDEKTPGFIVKDSEGNDISNENYEIYYYNNVYHGTATATLNLYNNYSGVYEKQFEIKKGLLEKKENPVVLAIDYGQTLGQALVSGGSFENSKNQVVAGDYEWADYNIEPDITDSEKTEYDLTFMPYDENFEPYEFKATVKVNKRTTYFIEDPTLSEITYGQTLSTVSFNSGRAGINDYYEGWKDIDGSFSWKDGSIIPDASEKNYGGYPAAFTAVFTPEDSDRYASCERDLSVYVKQASPVMSESPAASVVIQGSTLADSVINGGKFVGIDGTTEINGDYSWKDSSIVLGLDDSEKTEFIAVFTPSDLNYAACEIPLKVKVDKDLKNLINAEVDVETEYEYTGSEIKPEPIVIIGDKTLEKNTDYMITYHENINAGSNAYMSIAGKGNYKGSKNIEFKITCYDISKTESEKIVLKYTGSAVEPEPVLYAGNKKLAKGTDYTISGYEKNVDVGTANINIVGKGNYSGHKIIPFEIIDTHVDSKSLTNISQVANLVYANGTTLSSGVKQFKMSDEDGNEYWINYNKTKGFLGFNSKIWIDKSKNHYSTVGMDIFVKDGEVDGVYYNTSGISLGISAGVMSVSSKAVIDPKTYKLTDDLEFVKGSCVIPKGYEESADVLLGLADPAAKLSMEYWNYILSNKTGYMFSDIGFENYYSQSAVIDISDMIVELSQYSYIEDGQEKKPGVTVKDTNGKVLLENTDYTLKYSNNTNCGTATVTITGKGNYKGTKSVTYQIKDKYSEVEPNNSKEKATVMELGRAYNAEIGSYEKYNVDGEDVDWFAVNLKAGSQYRIRMDDYINEFQSTTLMIHLVDPINKDDYISYDMKQSGVSYYDFTAELSGMYYIKLNNYFDRATKTEHPYKLSVICIDEGDPSNPSNPSDPIAPTDPTDPYVPGESDDSPYDKNVINKEYAAGARAIADEIKKKGNKRDDGAYYIKMKDTKNLGYEFIITYFPEMDELYFNSNQDNYNIWFWYHVDTGTISQSTVKLHYLSSTKSIWAIAPIQMEDYLLGDSLKFVDADTYKDLSVASNASTNTGLKNAMYYWNKLITEKLGKSIADIGFISFYDRVTKRDTTIELMTVGVDGKKYTVSANMRQEVTYNGKKHITSYEKLSKTAMNDLMLTIDDGGLSLIADIKVKTKNNLNVATSSSDKKRPQVVLSYKAKKGSDKETKAFIKAINKELKNKPLYFDIVPIDMDNLSYIKVTADTENEKVKKVVVKNNGVEIKMKKADYSARFTSSGVTITGKRNFKGSVTVSN